MTAAEHRLHVDRGSFDDMVPAVGAALRALSQAVDDVGIDASLIELVRLRASQINRCAFCIQQHLQAARRLGIPGARLDRLAAWRESGVFSVREQAALAWTEALTLMGMPGAPAPADAEMRAHFTDREIVALTTAIATINAWNRIAGALHFTHR